MDANKRQRYEKIAEELTRLAGGRDNLQGIAHCATRLRIVLKDNDQADLKAMEDVDLAKGVFVAGDQVQIIFGAGLVNDVYEVIAEYNNMKNMSLSDLKTVANQKMNPLQRIIKALSDVFVDIMPGILAAALLTGLSGVLGNLEFVQNIETLYSINRLINIASGAIFGFLPLAVAYSACKRFGGRPILGIVIGCIMLSGSLADAYAAAQKLLERCPALTAIFAISDVTAMGVIRALRDMGKQVPEDISVVGYDGIVTGQYFLPRLTTVRQDTQRLAERGVETLLRGIFINGRPVHELIPFQLIQGESVARLS